jgi:carboxyl-terminal processing protease
VGDSSTFGKGTVQQPMDIGRMLPLFAARNRAGFLKVTIQKFYRPSGSSTQMDGVVPQVVIPSLSDALEIGEAYLDHPLPHDRIRPAPDFKPLAPEGLFIPRLNELSWNRINTCKDFAYLIEDVTKAKNRIKSNRLSLNKAAREKELEESDALQKARNIERRERFTKMGEEDAKTMIFYKLRLEDLETNGELKRYNPTAENVEFMRRAKDATADLDETPKWPSGIDPLKRESLAVLKDLVDLTVSVPLTSSAKDGSGAQ